MPKEIFKFLFIAPFQILKTYRTTCHSEKSSAHWRGNPHPLKSLLLEEKVAERKRGRMRCKTVGYSNNTSSVTFGDSFSSRRSLRRTDCHNQCAHWFRNDTCGVGIRNRAINTNLAYLLFLLDNFHSFYIIAIAYCNFVFGVPAVTG